MSRQVEIEMVAVRLEEESIHVLVRAEAPGLENYWWVIDTGAARSVVNRAVSSFLAGEESAGSPATGLSRETVETSCGVVRDLYLGANRFDALEVAIVDLGHISEEYARYTDKKIAGLLGSDFFAREKAVIDYERMVIRIHHLYI